MSGYRIAILKCDGCGEIWNYGWALNITEARRGAKEYGWSSTRRENDFCSRCTMEGVSNE